MANAIYGDTADCVFKEAVRFLEKKVAVTGDVYKTIGDQYKAVAFSVEGYTSLEVLNTFLDVLQEAVREGKTKEQFAEQMNIFLESNGYENLNPFKADVIFRTNLQTAYNAGHYISMTDETTKFLRPYWQYKTAGDGNVRADHALMADKVFPADDPIWDIWYPPNGFRCRCTVVSLSAAQVRKRNLVVENQMPLRVDYQTGEITPMFPDKGFSNNPAKQQWNPDVKQFGERLSRLYKDRNKAKNE